MTLGEKIILLRKQAGMSQSDFAEQTGVSRQSVSKWESGESMPDADRVFAISKLFGVSADTLLDNDKEIEDKPQEENKTDGADERTEDTPEEEGTLIYFRDTEIPDNEEEEEAEEDSGSFSKKTYRRYGIIVAVLSVVTAICIAVAVIVPEKLGSLLPDNTRQVYVMIHGLGGWGDGSGMNNIKKYWGSTTGDLAEYLTQQGYEVYTPSVGPVSSTWDRCCELYAVLFGGTVDYGKAHSEEHNHERYGRTYTDPMIKINKGEKIELNLIGHSFGGTTANMFASLLCYGDSDEADASENDLSPLFSGDCDVTVKTVTTLCTPHKGSSLTCILDSLGSVAGIDSATQLISSLCFASAGILNPADGIYDFMLDQFGIGTIEGGMTEISTSLSSFFASGNDHAGYELTPDGAMELSKKIKTVDSVYYFSYPYCTTVKSALLYTQVPKASTLLILQPFALAMGSYNGTTAEGIAIGEDWHENDGLVSVISAKCPFNAESEEMPSSAGEMKPGIWYVAPTGDGDHGTVIGLNADTETTNTFYTDLFTMIESIS